jgi:hypothetical protein
MMASQYLYLCLVNDFIRRMFLASALLVIRFA